MRKEGQRDGGGGFTFEMQSTRVADGYEESTSHHRVVCYVSCPAIVVDIDMLIEGHTMGRLKIVI